LAERQGLSPISRFPIPEGVVEVTDDDQLNLAFFELKNLKPKGTVLFSGETKEVVFQFYCGETREEGIFAKIDGAMPPHAKRVFEYLERYTRMEAFITLTLLQFKFVFIAPRTQLKFLPGGQRVLLFDFPFKILKTHRRKFIRIPFNENFPAELRFQTEQGPVVRKLKDLSREGMKIALEPGDTAFIEVGTRPKQSVLKVLNREMPVGVAVMAVQGTASAGLKIIAISEEDKLWIRDCIRILMKQLLKIQDQPVDDEIKDRDPGSNQS
jgi:hypothetical protein